MTLRKYKQSRKMRKHPRKSLKSRRVAKRRKNVRRTRRGGRRGPNSKTARFNAAIKLWSEKLREAPDERSRPDDVKGKEKPIQEDKEDEEESQ